MELHGEFEPFLRLDLPRRALILQLARYAQRENVWRHFRFTKTTARLSLIWGVLVPVGVFAFAQRQDVSSSPLPILRSREY